MADGGYSRRAQQCRVKLTTSSKNIARFVTATKFLETNGKNGRCLNQWTVSSAANQPPNQPADVVDSMVTLPSLNVNRTIIE